MQLFHGLGAYRGARTPLEYIQGAEKALAGVEVAAATRPIGPLGLLVDGRVLEAFPRDVWSWVDGEGRRHEGEGVEDHERASADGVDLADSAALERWFKDEAARPGPVWQHHASDYCEVFLKPRRVTAVWVKPYLAGAQLKAARILARRYKVRLVAVERFTRPWDVVGSYDYPGARYEALAAEEGWGECA